MALSETQRKDYSKRLSKAIGQVRDISRTVANAPEGSFAGNNTQTQPSGGDRTNVVNQPNKTSQEVPFNALPGTEIQNLDNNYGIDNFGEQAGRAGFSQNQFSEYVENTTNLTTEERDQIRNDLGVSDAEVDAFYIPDQGTKEVFEDAYDQSDLPETKARMQNVNRQIEKARTDLADAVEQIDDNPFLSEDTRVGRGRRRLDQAETRIANLQNRYRNLQGTYSQGMTELEQMMGYRDADISQRNANGTQKLNYLQKLAERKAEELRQDRFSDEIQEETVPYLQNYGQDGGDPSVVGSNPTGYYRWDPELQKYVEVEGPQDTPESQANAPSMTFQEFIRQRKNQENPYWDAQTPRGIKMLRREWEDMQQGQTQESAPQQPQTRRAPLSEEDTSPGDRRDLAQAGLSNAFGDVQTYFLASDNDFQNWIKRAYSAGAIELPRDLTVQEMKMIEEEYKKATEEASSSGSGGRTP